MKMGVQRFGNTLRAYRLGYRESERLKAFVRISAPVKGCVLISVCPLDQEIPREHRRAPKEHVCWWDRGDDIFDAIPVLRHVRRVKRILTFFVDGETGELL